MGRIPKKFTISNLQYNLQYQINFNWFTMQMKSLHKSFGLLFLSLLSTHIHFTAVIVAEALTV